jgi:hypothetical protein
MTPHAFRRLALALPEAREDEHMGHADFRVRGKIFATLGHPDARFATLLLTPEQQQRLVREAPAVFAAVKGGWGLKGSTQVQLARAEPSQTHQALRLAWERKAPARLSGVLSGARPSARQAPRRRSAARRRT